MGLGGGGGIGEAELSDSGVETFMEGEEMGVSLGVEGESSVGWDLKWKRCHSSSDSSI